MAITPPDLKQDFSEIKFEFTGMPYQYVFGLKKNKSVAETLQHPRYKQFASEVKGRYRNILDNPLGTAILRPKQNEEIALSILVG